MTEEEKKKGTVEKAGEVTGEVVDKGVGAPKDSERTCQRPQEEGNRGSHLPT